MDLKIKTVAFVANTSWSIYNFRLGIIKKLLSLGIKVVVVAPPDDYSSKIKSLGCDFYPISLDNYGYNPVRDFKTLIQLRKIYKKTRPGFIFHYTVKPNIYGTIAAKFCKIPSIAVTTGLGHLFLKNRLVTFISFGLYRIVGRLSQQIWFLNEDDKALFLKKKIIKPKKAFLLNSEGVDTDYFAPMNVQRDDDKTIFLYAGRLLKDKGVELLVEVSKQLQKEYSNIEVHLLGFVDESNPNSVLKKQLNTWEASGYIKYRGETDDVRPYIAAADCVVFPSFYKEGISRILLEAASMAKPIITTNQTGCREVVEDGVNGFLCEVKDISSLYHSMQDFIALSNTHQIKLGKNGRKKVLNTFDELLIIAIYLKVLFGEPNGRIKHTDLSNYLPLKETIDEKGI